jgi:hypothetical protein
MSEWSDHGIPARLRSPKRTISSALGPEADFPVLVGQSRDVVGVATDNRAKRLDAGDLVWAADGEVDERRAMAVARAPPQICFERVQNPIEPRIAVHMDMELIARVPIDAEGALEEVIVHHPFALMPIEVRLTYLHELRVDRAVGKELDLLRGHARHPAVPGGKLLGLRDDLRIVGIHPDQALAVRHEGPTEGHVGA